MSSLQKISFFFLIIITIAGCTTPPQTSNYYLIESTAQQSQLNSDQQIVLLPIQLSDYLKSANLHVKNNSGQVIYSSTDLWAEQPNKMLWRVIQQNLEEQTGHHVLANFDTSNHCAKIKIQLDELSPSNTGDVTTNGRWFIYSENKTLRTNKFSFIGHIESDGFVSSNLVLSKHLHQLSSQLNETIKSLGLCR